MLSLHQGMRKQGLAFTKFPFKLKQTDYKQTNETNSIIRDYGNSYRGNKRDFGKHQGKCVIKCIH